MSTSTRRRRSRHWDADEHHLSEERVPRRRRWRLLLAAAMLAVLVWLLPGLVAHTPLLRWAIRLAAADLKGTVTVESASLGWLSPVVLRGLKIRDAQEQPLLDVEELSISKPLLGLLWNRSDLGKLRLGQPKLSVVSRADGTNVEDVLAKYLAAESTGSMALQLEVVDGGLSITDQGNRQTWQLEKVSLTFSVPPEPNGPLYVKASADLLDAQHPGRLAAELRLGSAAGKDEPQQADLWSIDAAEIPLAMFESLLARFVAPMKLDGRVTGKVLARCEGDGPAAKTSIAAEVDSAKLTLAAAPLGTDRIELQRAQLTCQLAQQGEKIEIARAALECDAGNLSLSGTVQMGKDWSAALWDTLLSRDCQLEGRVDLARLAKLLPRLLRIRKNAEITSGQLDFSFSSRQQAQGMAWQGRLQASDLKAVAEGRPLAWEQPILVIFHAQNGPNGPVLQTLQCASDFLKLHAAGTLDDLAASASFNLKQLADQLGQFVDFEGIELAGEGWGQLNWKRPQQNAFELDLGLQARDFQLLLPRTKPWKEPNLSLAAVAKGSTDLPSAPDALYALLMRPAGKQRSAALIRLRVDEAEVRLTTDTDRLGIRLAEPVPDLRNSAWPLAAQLGGRLEQWLTRLRVFAALDGWQLAGACQLDAPAVIVSLPNFEIGRAKIDFRSVRLAAGELRIASAWLDIQEPYVELTASGSWDQLRRRLELNPAALKCGEAAAVDGNELVLSAPAQGPMEFTGRLKYRGDLGHLHPWFAGRTAPPKWRVAGGLDGSAELKAAAGQIGGSVDATVANFALSNAAGEGFQESQLRLVARGGFDPRAELLRIDQLQLAAGALGGEAAGRLTRTERPILPSSVAGEKGDCPPWSLELSGKLGYDLEKLAVLLRPYLGAGVRIAGRGSSPAAFRGPLDLAAAEANASARWDWAQAHGFRVGPGELKATLSKGVVEIDPLDLELSGGRLLLAPRVHVAAAPLELTLPPGPLARQIQITPAMCASGLKYIAPVLAEVADARGSFSIDLEGCRIPLADPAKGNLSGRLTIHDVQVGPGPLIRELAVLLGRETPARLRQESVVPFCMVDGRVYHKDLELIFPDLTIRTHGSVGLDGSVALMAEMPVPPKWLNNGPLGAAMRNQTIRLPIAGTLGKPELDQQALGQIGQQFMENTARNVLEDELGKQLERLFPPKK